MPASQSTRARKADNTTSASCQTKNGSSPPAALNIGDKKTPTEVKQNAEKAKKRRSLLTEGLQDKAEEERGWVVVKKNDGQDRKDGEDEDSDDEEEDNGWEVLGKE